MSDWCVEEIDIDGRFDIIEFDGDGYCFLGYFENNINLKSLEEGIERILNEIRISNTNIVKRDTFDALPKIHGSCIE